MALPYTRDRTAAVLCLVFGMSGGGHCSIDWNEMKCGSCVAVAVNHY